MRQRSVAASVAICLGLCVATLVGCGRSGGGGGTQTAPPASITSFTASSTTIQAGVSVSLTAVFSGGAGVVNPGNLAVTSGTPVSLSPAATTTYTLTVTPASGTAASQTVTVTVVPAPVITSFVSSAATIAAGTSANLMAVFSGGTGVVTPGSVTVTSGTPVSVSPATTTTYTLTVTPPLGAAIQQTVTVTVVPAPVITSFGSSPATIVTGTSSSLTAVFSGGTGVITPGNLAVTSGTPVSVSPTTTTTYTLTVTPTVGTAAQLTTTVTVVPLPTITSFSAGATTIAGGTSTNLTAVFSGGTGVITPGNVAVTSGTPVSVSPTVTTTYTLTVTPPAGTAITQMATVTVVPAPVITSFTANAATIAIGTSSNLTAVFSGGTGVITPGNIAATNGTAVSVSPTTTTTYTLTVTPTLGAAVTQTATVTVIPLPTITSFTASPATIAPSGSSNLTAVFANGTGVITPGNLAVTSGTAVKVSPTTTTSYTLTVTPTVGTAITQTLLVSIQSAISVDESSVGPMVTDQLLGMNMAAWYDPTTPAIVPAFQGAGIKAVRWPGGSWSDDYHWATNTLCGGTPSGNATFAKFVSSLAIPAGLDVALTADYGSNTTCNGPGQPSEAASWVAAAITDGITVSHMTVGNENYGSWETDMHTPASNQHNPTVYASSMTGSTGFYQMIKAASPNTVVGVVVDADNATGGWDQTVLANAKGSYDFVEFHYYPEAPNPTAGGQAPNDTFLTQQAAQGLTANINTIKKELTAAGVPNIPIYVGEMGSTYSDPGKQSMSITQALFAGQTLAEMMNDGVSRATWWLGFGGCDTAASDTAADFATSLYGWQNFGGYMVFSDGLPEYGCTAQTLAVGTATPTARAFQLFSNVAQDGDSVLNAAVNGDTTNVRAYAATHSGGATALVLFNLSATASAPVTVALSGLSTSSGVSVMTYSKAIYDMTQTNLWNGPTTTSLGAKALPLSLSLDPWSMNVVIFQP